MQSLRFTTGFTAAVLVVSSSLAACAGTPAPIATAQGAQSHPLILRSAADWHTAADFARRVSDVARVPVRDVSMVAPRLFALTLVCASQPACQEAVRRLAEANSLVLEVQTDQQRRLPTSPTRSTAQ